VRSNKSIKDRGKVKKQEGGRLSVNSFNSTEKGRIKRKKRPHLALRLAGGKAG